MQLAHNLYVIDVRACRHLHIKKLGSMHIFGAVSTAFGLVVTTPLRYTPTYIPARGPIACDYFLTPLFFPRPVSRVNALASKSCLRFDCLGWLLNNPIFFRHEICFIHDYGRTLFGGSSTTSLLASAGWTRETACHSRRTWTAPGGACERWRSASTPCSAGETASKTKTQISGPRR